MSARDPNEIGPYGQLLAQLELDFVRAPEKAQVERIDVSFLHRSFCIAGLPVWKPKNPAKFDRYDDTFSLNILSPARTLPGGREVSFGVPWGPRIRVLLLWASTQARDPRRGNTETDRWLEIPHLDTWIPSLGIPHTHAAERSLKEQLIKLAFAQFSMFLNTDDAHLLHDTKIIESAAFSDGDLEHFAEGRIGKVRWPMALKLSEQAFNTFRNPKAIPVPTHRLSGISDSALAIDAFLYLCYRLPELAASGGEASDMVKWRSLIAQFGKSGQAPSKFREHFIPALNDAVKAYLGSSLDDQDRVVATDEGLILRATDPAVLARSFVVSLPATGDTKSPKRKPRNRNAATAAPKKPVEDAA